MIMAQPNPRPLCPLRQTDNDEDEIERFLPDDYYCNRDYCEHAEHLIRSWRSTPARGTNWTTPLFESSAPAIVCKYSAAANISPYCGLDIVLVHLVRF